MTEGTAPELALAAIVRSLRRRSKRFALVGGLAVSTRAEVRFTRDVDVVVAVSNDQEAEELVYDLRQEGYTPVATVEHESVRRLATVRLLAPSGVRVDLLFASSGIETEIALRATVLELPEVGSVPVARAEELLAMKVLSMSEQRLQDRLDARRLLQIAVDLDLDEVREDLQLIVARGFNRGEDLETKLATLLAELR